MITSYFSKTVEILKFGAKTWFKVLLKELSKVLEQTSGKKQKLEEKVRNKLGESHLSDSLHNKQSVYYFPTIMEVYIAVNLLVFSL